MKSSVILSVLAKDLGLGGTALRSFMSTFRMTTHDFQYFQTGTPKDLAHAAGIDPSEYLRMTRVLPAAQDRARLF
jgi:hypothetical protein